MNVRSTVVRPDNNSRHLEGTVGGQQVADSDARAA